VKFDLQMSGDLRIEADVTRLQQVLSNLLSNAVQHGDRRQPISLSAHGRGDDIVLRVANAGNPIPSGSLQVIFEPLVQAPSDPSDLDERSKTSLGLGLYIVREIVRGHDGDITVQSSAKLGTEFSIQLPRRRG
jgi:signal transduction histidine kinase